ncbi:hypothetical protein J5Y04_12930 [Kitasatospora sp. RG8]|uniref:hypothetical protein n=1 Tax=Kitasatospora sp. RG8 TaxID=2820815 RepID=UPI001AE06F2A|nr:hypothetical protein [Kitasatospora sp. RG8]MBP0450455.1 hypothetical protein [Kitasatospora sp. RG8]
MVDHRELFEDVTATLARAGFDTGKGPSGLRIGHRPQGVVVGWTPAPTPARSPGPSPVPVDGQSPDDGIRAAVSGAVAVVLRESGYQVAEAGRDGLLVTSGPGPAPAAAARADEGDVVPEQWWG